MNSYVGFGLSHINLDLSESTEELLWINFLISVKAVEVSEDSSQASDGLSTSGSDLVSNLFENYKTTKYEGSAKFKGVTRLRKRVLKPPGSSYRANFWRNWHYNLASMQIWLLSNYCTFFLWLGVFWGQSLLRDEKRSFYGQTLRYDFLPWRALALIFFLRVCE